MKTKPHILGVEDILDDEKKRMSEKRKEAFWNYIRPRVCVFGMFFSGGFVVFLFLLRFGKGVFFWNTLDVTSSRG